jgi:hypothetical protein
MIGQGVPEAKSHLHSALIDSWPETTRGDASPRTAMFGSTAAIGTTSETLLKIGGVFETEEVMLFTCVAPRTKSKGLPIGGPLFSKNMLFTRVAPRTKSKGLPIGGPLFNKK